MSRYTPLKILVSHLAPPFPTVTPSSLGLLGFPVAFKALFPGILSGIQGLNGIDLNGIVASLNGIDRP